MSDLKKCIHVIADCGFTASELCEGFVFKAFLEHDDAEASAKSLKEYCREINLDISQAHIPSIHRFRPGKISCESFEVDYKQLFAALAVLGVKTAVFHPVDLDCRIFDFSRFGEWSKWLDLSLEVNSDVFRLLSATGAEYDIKIAVENQIEAKGVGARFHCGHPCEMEKLLENVPELGVNIDTAHACANKLDVPTLIRWAGSRLWGLHVSDSDGQPHDLHLIPGKGVLDWPEIFTALKEASYAGDFHLELPHERGDTLGETKAAAIKAFSVTQKMVEAYG